jgi:hypothetical protein
MKTLWGVSGRVAEKSLVGVLFRMNKVSEVLFLQGERQKKLVASN